MVVAELLLENIALLVALTVLLQFIERNWHGGPTGRRILLGGLYGIVAIIGMVTPLVLGSGVIFDGRSIVLSIAGLFGGPLVVVIAGGMAAAYRMWLGGGGTPVGVATIVMAAGFGIAGHYLRRRNPMLVRPLGLWVFGLIVHAIMLVLFLWLPGDPLRDTLPAIAAPIMIAYPIAGVLIGRVLVDQENRHLKRLTSAEGSQIAEFLTENTIDCIWLIDMDLEVRYVNAAVEAMFGFTPREYLGTRLHDHLDAPHMKQVLALFERRMARLPENDVERFETELLHKDGRSIPVDVLAGTLLGDDGRPVALYGSTRDITDRKRLEISDRRAREDLEHLVQQRTEQLQAVNEELRSVNDELMDANEQLSDANDAKNRFLRAMSHELRTPLNSIIGFSNILAKGMAGEMNDEQRRQAEMINHSGQHLLALINDILDLSRIEADRLDLALEAFDISELARDVLLSMVTVAADKGVDIRLDAPPEPVTIQSDPRKVRQILINLAGNAVKFTNEGSVTLRVHPSNHGLLAVDVIDTGPGIAEDDLERIFDEFAQAGSDDEATREGSGLGLAIARGLARALGGAITVESAPNSGATFTLLLPHEPADRD